MFIPCNRLVIAADMKLMPDLLPAQSYTGTAKRTQCWKKIIAGRQCGVQMVANICDIRPQRQASLKGMLSHDGSQPGHFSFSSLNGADPWQVRASVETGPQ